MVCIRGFLACSRRVSLLPLRRLPFCAVALYTSVEYTTVLRNNTMLFEKKERRLVVFVTQGDRRGSTGRVGSV